jgi:hypothetical protein
VPPPTGTIDLKAKKAYLNSQKKIVCVGLKVDPQLLFSYIEQQMDTVPKELAPSLIRQPTIQRIPSFVFLDHYHLILSLDTMNSIEY